jgi:hypothetical protein
MLGIFQYPKSVSRLHLERVVPGALETREITPTAEMNDNAPFRIAETAIV